MAAPNKDEAHQFALMLHSGMPAVDAIQYFFPDETETGVINAALKEWVKSGAVQRAVLALQGKAWQDMSLDEKISLSIDKHYAELAYFLYSHNYSQLVGADRQKADICRASLEARIAGTAGKMGPLEQFWSDIRSGKVKLAGLPA